MTPDQAGPISAKQATDLLAALEDLYTLIHDMDWSAPDNRYHSITNAATVIGKARGA